MAEMINGFTGFSPSVRNNPDYEFSGADRAVAAETSYAPEELDKIDERDRRWSWVEIDLSAIQHNVMATKRLLKPGTHLMAVVKADAYGHGAVRVARAATAAGADYLGVATVDEGVELREAGLTQPILMLAEPPVEAVPLLLAHRIMPSVYTHEFAIAYAEAADTHGLRAPFHLAINTGMNRIGVRHDQVVDFVKKVSFHRALQLEGCFTHFATADAMETLDWERQINRFWNAMGALEKAGINPGIVHCDNSASIYRYPKTHFDMVRLGISLYGYQPAPDTNRFIELKPAMSVHARITNVMSVPMSEGVSYGMNYRSPGSVKICTVPLGYCDGLIRLCSGKINFAYQDQSVRQVGNICMDQCMFEVDMRSRAGRPTPNPQIGDEVIIAGPHPSVDCSVETMAKKAQTIEHEVTIGFSHRMERFYK